MSPKRRRKSAQGSPQPEFVAASVDHSGDDLDDKQDDLQFGNVDAGEGTTAEHSNGIRPHGTSSSDSQLPAFEIIVRGLVQERQAVSNVTCAVLDHHITIHYPNAKKALLTNSKTLLQDVQDLIGNGNIQVSTGLAPAGSPRVRYELTDKDSLPPPQEIEKILAWVGKLAAQPANKSPAKNDAKWRKRALDAIVMRSMHDLLDWGGMHATVLKHALKDLDKHQQIHRCLVLSMQTTDMVVADLVERGLLERGGMSPLSKARSRSLSTGNVQLRCTTPVSLSQLQAAYAVFQLPVPSYAAIAARQAQPSDQADETQKSALHSASLQPNSAQSKAPQAQLSSESAPQSEEDVTDQPEHASLGAAAENGATVPAYALQMDGPNDVLDHSAASTAAAAAAAATAAAADAQPESTFEPRKAQDHVAALIAEQALGAVHGHSLGQSAELASGAAATAGAHSNALDGLMSMVKEDRGKSSVAQHQSGPQAIPCNTSHRPAPEHALQLRQTSCTVPEQLSQNTSAFDQGLAPTAASQQAATDLAAFGGSLMPALAPPAGITWLEAYAAVHGINLQQASPSEQGALLQPPNEPEPSNMLPPALATLDPNSGRAVNHDSTFRQQAAPDDQASRKRALENTGAETVKRQCIAEPHTASAATAAHTELRQSPHQHYEEECASYRGMPISQSSAALSHQRTGPAPLWSHGSGSYPNPQGLWQPPPHLLSNSASPSGGNEEELRYHSHQRRQQQRDGGFPWQPSATAAGPSATAAGPSSQANASRSLLHDELTEFATLASPTEAEQQAVRDALDSVIRITKIVWPESRTVLFGSQATNLALPGSDLDIVVLGVSENITHAASGFNRNQRELLGELLEDLLACLQTAGILKGSAKIIDARVPIIKCTLKFGPGLAADISLGAVNGAAAVQNVCQMVATAPPLRVLVLAIKALLKETMLNEVFTGGLSSYSIVNMVMAHLLCMGYQLPNLPGPVGNGPGFWGSLVPAQNWPEADLGVLLLSFLKFFGTDFDYSQHAVSVSQGGIIEKKREWQQVDRPWLLAVEDPQQLGKDIGSGTFNIRNVRHLFAAAAGTLREAQQTCSEQQQWSAVQADGASSSASGQSFEERFPLLSELIVLDVAVGRTRVAAKKRNSKWRQAAQQNKLNIVDKHCLLKHHCSLVQIPADPPTFHVGRKAKGKRPAVTVQVSEKVSKRDKNKAGQKGNAKPQTRSQDAAALPSSYEAEQHDASSDIQLTDLDAFLPPAKAMTKRQKQAAKKAVQTTSGRQSSKQKRLLARAQLMSERALDRRQQQEEQANALEQSQSQTRAASGQTAAGSASRARNQTASGRTAAGSASQASTAQQPAAGGESVSKKARRKAKKASAKETSRRQAQRDNDRGRGVQAGGVRKKHGGKFAIKNSERSAKA